MCNSNALTSIFSLSGYQYQQKAWKLALSLAALLMIYSLKYNVKDTREVNS